MPQSKANRINSTKFAGGFKNKKAHTFDIQTYRLKQKVLIHPKGLTNILPFQRVNESYPGFLIILKLKTSYS